MSHHLTSPRLVSSVAAGAIAVLGVVAPSRANAQTVELDRFGGPDLVPAYESNLDRFGTGVSLDADRMLAGAAYDNDLGPQSGSAFVYERDPLGAWQLVAQLYASDGAASDHFGISVALRRERALVGANRSATLSADGVAYVFDRGASGLWLQAAQLACNDPQAGDDFGLAVALSDGRALVAAPDKSDAFLRQGCAYVFERQAGGNWLQAAKLTAPLAASDDKFGTSVALDGDRAAVGVPFDDDLGSASGSVCVFERTSGGHWIFAQKLTAADGDADDRFGSAVALDGERLIVGAAADDALGTSAGSAYVFERSASGTWAQVAKLTASDAAPYDGFGTSAALDGDRAAIGAPIGGFAPPRLGATYVFERSSGGAWSEVAQLHGADSADESKFGASVDVSGDRVCAGAPEENSAGPLSGRAYLYDLAPLGTDVDSISLSSGGVQPLVLDAGHLHGGELHLVLGTLSGASPGTALPGGLVLPLNFDAYTAATLAAPGALPLVHGFAFLSEAGSSAAEVALFPGTDPALAGLVAHHAFVAIDVATPSVTLASNALAVELVP